MIKSFLSYAFISALFVSQTFAQSPLIRKAVEFYQVQNFDSAAYFIDQAALSPTATNDANTFYYKGIIYKERFNNTRSDQRINARKTAIESFDRFLELSTDASLKQGVEKNIIYLVQTLYNDAAAKLNIETYQESLELFEQYKEMHKTYGLPDDIQSIEMQYNLVLANIYSELYERHREENKNNKFFEKVVVVYQDILKAQPDNWSANYNLGIHYYNEAVNRIKVADFDLDIVAVGLVEDEAVKIFEMALPYMQKAHDLKPNRKEPIIGLSGIYFSLNELDISEEFNKKVKSLENQ